MAVIVNNDGFENTSAGSHELHLQPLYLGPEKGCLRIKPSLFFSLNIPMHSETCHVMEAKLLMPFHIDFNPAV